MVAQALDLLQDLDLEETSPFLTLVAVRLMALLQVSAMNCYHMYRT